MKLHPLFRTALIGSCLWLASCSIHSVDVQQGNIIKPDMISRLQIGMSKKQVEFVMGKPVLVDLFHQDRWDYVYIADNSRRDTARQHIILYFQNDALARIVDTAQGQPTTSTTP